MKNGNKCSGNQCKIIVSGSAGLQLGLRILN